MPTLRSVGVPVKARKIYRNPTVDDLRILAGKQPNVRQTCYGNLNTTTEVLARSNASTFFVTDQPDDFSGQCLSVEKGAEICRLQDEYLLDREVIIIDGYIGDDPEFRTRARLIIDSENANVAAMQQVLYYPLDPVDSDTFEPELTIIYTGGLKAAGYPDERVIAVFLEQGVTRVLGTDYFGESKKSGLRMWNQRVFERGGLPLHAGCKIIPVQGTQKVGLIVGLSGTGKTTTTFTEQNHSMPVQDDFVAWMPNGRVYATENGCFAKTYGLSEESEPVITRAVKESTAWIENVSQNAQGDLDFFDDSYTQNGRAVVRMADIEGAAAANQIQRPDFLLILNRSQNVIPAVARLSLEQAAAYFMLGETMGTSAGGAAEAGKSLRIPGTNPFFPLRHDHQGNRLFELMDQNPIEVYLMNTGWVGGGGEHGEGVKVKIRHSSAIVKGIAEGTIEWEQDPDFGFQVATHVPGIGEEDAFLLCPRLMYESQQRTDEYQRHLVRLKRERKGYLEKFPLLRSEIVSAAV
ncbi:MAG: phosphoenolpyruvate carboxykinase [Planctomycetota bacterium]|nr:phosphoenolpyruvate carboxykinase [Planctomycetota bacterium]